MITTVLGWPPGPVVGTVKVKLVDPLVVVIVERVGVGTSTTTYDVGEP
jgi:hypothetical protein